VRKVTTPAITRKLKVASHHFSAKWRFNGVTGENDSHLLMADFGVDFCGNFYHLFAFGKGVQNAASAQWTRGFGVDNDTVRGNEQG